MSPPLRDKSDAEVQAIWDAIWALDPWDRPDVEWQEDVYSEISMRGLRSGPVPYEQINGEWT